eukprot:CAMPEP_0204575980 /NCGR_PEP_ID=MMETSP0661-20131031/41503_1 /ASSEMBLY_ACC=CAM_ASM_000606 /TAXON_ID=109239 /ORGANISM="Alexandrium margalefi, Strain AMGDE01CS-322" /LENGTH=420 /DNA_ID=CAMNT_0051584669 /DNA_START=74 /DNA_END=1333 /DNA_ORIENTATION=+
MAGAAATPLPSASRAFSALAIWGALAVQAQRICDSPYEESCHASLTEAEAADPRNQWTKVFFEDGFNVVPSVLSQDQVRRAQAALANRWKAFDADPFFGRERQYNLLELDPVFGEFLDMIPDWIDALMHQTMGPWIVGAYDIYKFNPVKWKVPEDVAFNITRDSLHSDFPYGHSPLPEKMKFWPHTVQLIFMVTDFNSQNGGTITVPGSYRDRLAYPKGKEEVLRNGSYKITTGRQGDMLVYLGGTWHGNGINVADAARIGVIAQCLPFFFKPMQAQAFTMPQRVVQRLSQKSRNRMGFSGHTWFWHTSASMWMGQPHHRIFHISDFIWDAVLYGYPVGGLPMYRFLASLVLVWVPLLFWRWYGFKSAARFALHIFLGVSVGVGICFEKFLMPAMYRSEGVQGLAEHPPARTHARSAHQA